MNNNYRWIPVVAAFVLAALVGVFAYNAGVASGIAQSGKIAVAPYPYYGWHPFFFGPIVFFFVIALVLRGMFWRAAWHHRGRCGGGYRQSLDEWHKQAHEKMV